MAYDAREYGANYAAAPYPAEIYPEEENWEQYMEQPRRVAPPQRNPRGRRAQSVPVEMAVEETPAVIVESQMVSRQDDYTQEEPAEDRSAFSPEQMEELARTEAEVVVSSSVADVVDLPMAPDEEGQPYDGSDDEDIHVIAEMDAEDEADESSAEAATLTEEEEQPGRFEEQDLFEEEDTPQISVVEETAFTTPGEEVSGTAEEEPGEAESFGTESEPPSEAEDEPAFFESDEESWEMQEDVSAETPGGAEEMLAGGMNETLEEDDDDTPEHITGEDYEEEVNPRPPSPTIHARELLAQGMPIEEVAKETGMGRRAVELLAQMAKGQLNSQDGD